MPPVEIDSFPMDRRSVRYTPGLKIVERAMVLPLVNDTKEMVAPIINEVTPIMNDAMTAAGKIHAQVRDSNVIYSKVEDVVMEGLRAATPAITTAVDTLDTIACSGVDQLAERLPLSDYVSSFNIVQYGLKKVDTILSITEKILPVAKISSARRYLRAVRHGGRRMASSHIPVTIGEKINLFMGLFGFGIVAIDEETSDIESDTDETTAELLALDYSSSQDSDYEPDEVSEDSLEYESDGDLEEFAGEEGELEKISDENILEYKRTHHDLELEEEICMEPMEDEDSDESGDECDGPVKSTLEMLNDQEILDCSQDSDYEPSEASEDSLEYESDCDISELESSFEVETTVEMLVAEYESTLDSDYEPSGSEESLGSSEFESDEEVSLETITEINMVDETKRVPIPSEVDIWVPQAQDDDLFTDEETTTTAELILGEDLDSMSEDSDVSLDSNDWSEDSLEYETDEEISLETIDCANILDSKRVSKPAGVDVWLPAATEESEDEETTVEMLCEENIVGYNSSLDSDYSPNEETEDSLDYESDNDISMEILEEEIKTGIAVEEITEDNIIGHKRRCKGRDVPRKGLAFAMVEYFGVNNVLGMFGVAIAPLTSLEKATEMLKDETESDLEDETETLTTLEMLVTEYDPAEDPDYVPVEEEEPDEEYEEGDDLSMDEVQWTRTNVHNIITDTKRTSKPCDLGLWIPAGEGSTDTKETIEMLCEEVNSSQDEDYILGQSMSSGESVASDEDVCMEGITEENIVETKRIPTPCELEIWCPMPEEEEESEVSDEECDEYMTTMEMFLTTEYISGEDSDYSPDEESDDSMEDESDCDISLETVSIENILETKRVSIPCAVELWVPMGCDEEDLTYEDELVTVDMLCEDIDSAEDSDYIVGESSIDSLESESDGEICMETITEDNVIHGKRTSKPCDVEIWCPQEEEESEDDFDEELTTLEMFLTTEYVSGEDSDYSPDEESDVSFDDESDGEISLECISMENIIETKRTSAPCEVELWVPMGCDETELTEGEEDSTIDLLCDESDSSQDSDFVVGESSYDSLESEPDDEICLQTCLKHVSDNELVTGKRISKPCDVDIWCPAEEDSDSEFADSEGESDEEDEDVVATTIEMLCETVTMDYHSGEDADYSPDDESDDSLEDASDCDMSMEAISTEHVLDTKRITIPCEVELWVPKMTEEPCDVPTTLEMLCEDISSGQDSDYSVGESSDDSLESESDDEVSLEAISQDNILPNKRVNVPCDIEIWCPMTEESSTDESEEESEDEESEMEEIKTTMELLCDDLVQDYMSEDDCDYSPGEESEDSLDYETDGDVSMETIITDNIMDNKRTTIPCEVDLWTIYEDDTGEGSSEEYEEYETTAAMLCEEALEDYNSAEDSDFIDSEDAEYVLEFCESEDSLEYETDEELHLETIHEDNILDYKRVSQPSEVDLWILRVEEEPESDCEEETTVEMLCKNVLDSSQDSDYIPDDLDEMTDDSLEYDSEVSDDETDLVYEDDILNFKRVPKVSEVDIWIPKALDIDDTVQMLLVDYDSSQDSDYCPSEESEEDSDGEESSDGDITDEEMSFISQNDILDTKRMRIHSEVDLWAPQTKMTIEEGHDGLEEPQEIIGEIVDIVDKIRSLRHVEDKHPWLSETTADEVVVNTVQVDCIVSTDQLEDSCIEATEEVEQLRSDETGAGKVYVELELETDSDEAKEDDSCQEVTYQEEVDELAGEVEEVEVEQLRSDETGELELETDSDETEEENSCQEVTHDSCQHVTCHREGDELAGEVELVEVEQLRSDETGVSGELETDRDEAEEQDSCQEVTCLDEVDELVDEVEQVEVEQLRSDETGEFEFETDSDEAENDSCQEVTCLSDSVQEFVTCLEDVDELAGEVEVVQPMEAEPRDELADFQEVELLRAEEIEAGPLAGDLLDAEEEARSLSDVVNEILNVVESAAEEEEEYLL